MIKNKTLADRYARAFMEYGRETVGIEKALSNLTKARRLLLETNQLMEMFQNPGIAVTDKYSIIDKVFIDDFSDEVKDFLKVLVENGRISFFYDIVEYARIKYSHDGMEEVLIRTSYILDLDLMQRIETALEKRFNKKFKFYFEIDGDLLGGVQVVIGNTLIDGSLRKSLKGLKKKMKLAKAN